MRILITGASSAVFACRIYFPGVGGQRGGANARFGVFAYGQKMRLP